MEEAYVHPSQLARGAATTQMAVHSAVGQLSLISTAFWGGKTSGGQFELSFCLGRADTNRIKHNAAHSAGRLDINVTVQEQCHL